ncbi:hypothetical protein [Spiroplasma platyhelix]|uniref:Transmembrane protein n=1 Tax=Spiroplasma platyhelix PALS-1 TaxID=1276218 RepID=A0A846TX10_9MOLU|nr:hypothetical protein [Spiroplasma platyhelix]MBE4704218.1 hypothetical protein [Spiroplasma platyhelix PALS-1]NKE38591.1 hypothetical protein [Spiroplasma platyhelix PALS-1]UJB28802.1 hypothetical protein SPLAT_v1c00350 [Spiroplasma platyhelix PALS-1]
MNFQVFGNRIKLFFLITIIFLMLTIGMFVAFLVIQTNPSHTWYLMMFVWFGTTTTLLFHYLLWRNLPFLQALDIARTNNYTFFLSLIVYIILFPIIAILSLAFLVIFTIAILILWIKSLFKRKKGKDQL